MVDLLSKRPDLRTEEEETQLRRALSERLDEARAMEPDVAYRQLIADTLDYKKWHEMSVMVRRSGSRETKLTRRTPLSEGEKKLVTYLPLFAAVAASYDALAEQNGAPRRFTARGRQVHPAGRRVRQGVGGQPPGSVRVAGRTRSRLCGDQRATVGRASERYLNWRSPRWCAMRASE